MADKALDVEEGAQKGSGDFLRFYVIVMALMAMVLAWFWRNAESQANEYRKANDAARAIFGDAVGAPVPDEAVPRTVRGLGVGVLKYLATNRELGKSEGEIDIPVKTINDRAEGNQVKPTTITGQQVVKNPAKRFEEVSVTVTLEPTDLDALARFLYSIEQSSPIFRILDVSWDLKTNPSENPYSPGTSPGHQIGRPRVKIGFRRPITGSSR